MSCRKCSRPTADSASLCGGCLDGLRVDLNAVPELATDLLVTRTKQDVISDRAARVSGSPERPLGYRPGALDAATILDSTVRYWATVIAVEFETATGEKVYLPASGVALAAWLARHPETIRQFRHADELANQIAYAVGKARAATDRPPEKVYAGPCGCGTDLYAREQAREIVCPECRSRYTVEARWQWMLDAVREHIATAADIAAGVGERYGAQLNRKTINKWHSRGRLIPLAWTEMGDPMFRVGDVLDLAAENTRRKTMPIARSA